MSSKTILITGANRGIGLALCENYVRLGYQVIATKRKGSRDDGLASLGREHASVTIADLEITQEMEAQNLARTLEKKIPRLDVLINNAGVLLEYDTPFEKLSFDKILQSFQVNTLGTLNVTRAFLPLLQKSPAPVLASISSKVGSIADNGMGFAYGYRISKTALNMANKSLSIEYPNIICVVLHPGWVQTEMGGTQAPVVPQESAQGLVKVIEGLTKKDTGRFLDFRGEEIPW